MNIDMATAEPDRFRVTVVVPLRRHTPSTAADGRRPEVDIVIPVHNREHDLARRVRRMHSFLRDDFPFTSRLTIADGASTDRTWTVASQLAAELPEVRVLRLSEQGRGRALAAAWLTSDARVVAHFDAGMSADPWRLLPLVVPVISGRSDICIGTPLAQDARIVRGTGSELMSRGYSLLLRLALRARVTDARANSKAMRADVARRLIPTVISRNRFFDIELLVRAERAGLRVHEVPHQLPDDRHERAERVQLELRVPEPTSSLSRSRVNRPTNSGTN